MSHRVLATIIAPLALASLALGCATEPADEAETSESAVISDATSITRRDDGNFDVLCRGENGAPNYTEIASGDDVLQNRVREGPPAATAEPMFDRDCGPTLTPGELARFFLPGMTKTTLGKISLRFREHRCNSLSGCTEWSDLPPYAGVDASAELVLNQIRNSVTGQKQQYLGLLVDATYAGNLFRSTNDAWSNRVHDDGKIPNFSLLEYRLDKGNVQPIRRNVPLTFSGRLGAECGYFHSSYSYADPENNAQQIVQEGTLTIRYAAQ